MATVLVGAYAQDPATTWPNLYSSCVWNFVTGWTCQTNDAAPPPPPPPSSSPVPAPNGGSQLPIMGGPSPSMAGGSSNGCCGCSGAATAPAPGGVQVPGLSLATSAAPVLAKPCCGKCAPKGRGLILVAALVTLVLVVRARLNA